MLVGGALVVLGVFALIETGVDTPLDQPVEDVLGYAHTPLLGIIEIGVGALLVLLSLRPGGRWFAAVIGLGLVLAGLLVLAELDWAVEELGAESGLCVDSDRRRIGGDRRRPADTPPPPAPHGHPDGHANNVTDLRTTATIPGQRGAPVGLLQDAGDPFMRLESSREFAGAILAARFVELSADVQASSRSEDYSVMVDDIEVLVCPASGPCSPFATSGEVAPRRCTAPATVGRRRCRYGVADARIGVIRHPRSASTSPSAGGR